MIPVRGYTMTELVMAASLSLLACLGGATAVQVVGDAAARARADRSVLDVVKRADAAAPRGTCAVLAAAAGRDVCAPALPAGPVVFRTPEGVEVVLTAVPATAPGLLDTVTLVTRPARGEGMRHALFTSR